MVTFPPSIVAPSSMSTLTFVICTLTKGVNRAVWLMALMVMAPSSLEFLPFAASEPVYKSDVPYSRSTVCPERVIDPAWPPELLVLTAPWMSMVSACTISE